MKHFALLFLLLTIQLSAQIPEITKFSLQDSASSVTSSHLLEAPNGNLIMFWSESNDLFLGVSKDNGKSWKDKSLLVDDVLSFPYNAGNYIGAIVTDDNKILLAYISNNRVDNKYFIKYLLSTDNGLNWTSPQTLNEDGTYHLHFSISKMLNGEIWVVFSSEYIKSIDNGITWSTPQLLVDETFSKKTSTSVQSLNDSTLILFYKNNNGGIIFYRTSNDNGLSWNSENELIENNDFQNYFQSIHSAEGDIYLVIRDSSGSIYYLKNINKTTEWTETTKFTNYVGDNNFLKLTTIGNKIGLSFASNRWNKVRTYQNSFYEYNIWYGVLEESIDISTPPLIEYCRYTPEFPLIGDSILFTANVYDEDSLQSVKLNIFYDEVLNHSVTIKDSLQKNFYSTTITNLEYHNLMTYSISALDMQNYELHSEKYPIAFESPYGVSKYLVDINNLKMPLLNNGILGDAFIPQEDIYSATFDDKTIIFSSGFFLSGKSEEEIFSNGIFSSSRIKGIYKPGNIGSHPGDGRNKIYIVESSDTPFGQSWQAWKNAVLNGAHFYDGDNDGVYNPVDKNGNGIWDINEDKPDLIGDITTWCVYNDGDDGNTTTPFNMDKGIEIKQTLFASKSLDIESLQNTIFVRYEIENKNPLVSKYDSVYFGVVTDPDIGYSYHEDLVSADTLLNAGYAYKKEPDDSSGYGDNPPSIMVQLLEGPHSYIPGETFIDNNSNQIFDNGDVAIDSAQQRLGPDRGIVSIPGAKNLSMTKFYHFFRYGFGYSSPNNITEMRNELLPGLDQNGNSINVCELQYGNGALLSNCEEINNHFMYSGNPVDGSGWLCTNPADTRMVVSTGPFELVQGKPITIIVAFIVGRGNDPLNSITVVKNYAFEVAKVFERNFIDLPVGIKNKPQIQLPTEYSLLQNYPNPFNPTTAIKYDIVKKSKVDLRIYNILGQEVITLVNKLEDKGSKTVLWNGRDSFNKKVSSGIYFYRISAGNWSDIKKMILLK